MDSLPWAFQGGFTEAHIGTTLTCTAGTTAFTEPEWPEVTVGTETPTWVTREDITIRE